MFFFFSCRGADSAGYSHTRVPGARPLPSHPQQVLVCPRAHPELNHPTSNQREGLNLFAPSNHLSHLPLVSPPISLAQPIIRPITLSTVESSRLTSERGQKRPDPENFVKSTADLDSNKLSLCSPIRPATLPSSSQRCNCYSRRLSCFIRADQRLAACPVDSEPASSRNPPDCTGDRKTVSRPVSSEQLSPATDRKATDQRYEAAFLPLPFCSSSRAVILSLPPISRCTPPPPQIASILSWFWPGCLAAWPPPGSHPACDAEPCPLQPISPSIIQTQCNECLPTSRSATVNNTSGARLRSHLSNLSGVHFEAPRLRIFGRQFPASHRSSA